MTSTHARVAQAHRASPGSAAQHDGYYGATSTTRRETHMLTHAHTQEIHSCPSHMHSTHPHTQHQENSQLDSSIDCGELVHLHITSAHGPPLYAGLHGCLTGGSQASKCCC